MAPRAAASLAGLAVAVWVAAHAPALVSVPAIYPGYHLLDDAALQLAEPVLHAPWIGTVLWPFAALLALCLAGEAWLLAAASGASTPAAAAVVAALALSTPWREAVRQGAPLAVAVAFAWLAWMFLLASDRADHADAPDRADGDAAVTARVSRGTRHAAAGILCWMVAIVSSWLAVLLAPVVIAGLTVDGRRRRVRLALVIAALVAAAAGLWLYGVRIASLAGRLAAPGVPRPSALDTLAAIVDQAPRRLDPLGGAVDAGVLAAVTLALIGIVGARLRKRWRVGLVVCGAALMGVAFTWPLWMSAAVRFALWLAVPFVAVGLTLAAGRASPRWRTLATVAGGVVLCVMSSVHVWTADAAARARRAHDALAPLLGALAVDEAQFVVEDLGVDAAVVAAYGRQPSWRLAREPGYVAAAMDDGRTVLAGPIGRRYLELAGFRFQPTARNLPAGSLAVARVTDRLHCAVVRADRWSQLPGLEYTGRLGIELPGGAGGSLTLIVGDDVRPRLALAEANGAAHAMRITPLATAPSVDAPPPDYWFDGGDPALAPAEVARVVIPAHPTAPVWLDLALGRRAPRVLARLTDFDDAARGRVCAAPLAVPELWADDAAPAEATVPLALSAMLPTGWYGLEGTAPGRRYRWTAAAAIALVASARQARVRVMLDAEPAAAEQSPALRLRVNGVAQPARRMPARPAHYEWTVPASVWLAGTNELAFSVSAVRRPADAGGADTRLLGMKVTRLTVRREQG